MGQGVKEMTARLYFESAVAVDLERLVDGLLIILKAPLLDCLKLFAVGLTRSRASNAWTNAAGRGGAAAAGEVRCGDSAVLVIMGAEKRRSGWAGGGGAADSAGSRGDGRAMLACKRERRLIGEGGGGRSCDISRTSAERDGRGANVGRTAEVDAYFVPVGRGGCIVVPTRGRNAIAPAVAPDAMAEPSAE